MKNIASETTESKLDPLPSGNQIQPNAVDITLGRVFMYDPLTPFSISEDGKQHRNTREMVPDPSGWFHLSEGAYEIQFEQTVQMGPNEAGWVITRSTLNRNGLFITSGLYDSGYHGAMAGCLHVDGGPAKIKVGTRIGQFLTFQAESLKQYDGSYGITKDGVVKPDEQKYLSGGQG